MTATSGTPHAATRAVRLTASQMRGYAARWADLQAAQAALDHYTAGVLNGRGIPRGTVVGFDPDACTLHVVPTD